MIERRTWFDSDNKRWVTDEKGRRQVPKFQVKDLKMKEITHNDNVNYKGKLVVSNTFIWSDDSKTKRHRITKFKYKGDIYEYDRYLIYSR